MELNEARKTIGDEADEHYGSSAWAWDTLDERVAITTEGDLIAEIIGSEIAGYRVRFA